MVRVAGPPESVAVDGQTVRFIWRGDLSSGDGESVILTLSKFDFVLMIEQLMAATKDKTDVRIPMYHRAVG